MSTLYDVKEIIYTGNKPSKRMILGAIETSFKQGHKAIEISWGENMLELMWHDSHGQWYGSGWIRGTGGDDLAHEMNTKGLECRN